MTECRFGFTQALRSWPENAAARAGLAECLELMVGHEVDQRDLEGARALYAELGAPRPELAARIEALATELAAAAGREARLRALERERDLSVGSGAQLLALATLPAFATGVVIYLLGRSGGQALTPRELLAPPALATVVLGAALLFLRRRLAGVARKALMALALAPLLCVVHRVAALVAGERMAPTFAGDLLLACGITGAVALVAIPRIGWVVVPFAAGALVVTARPDLALPAFAASVVSGFLTLLWSWRRSVKSARAR